MNIESEPQPVRDYSEDRPSARTEEEREAHFLAWWETNGQHYEAAVIAAGGTPWTTDLDERPALWFQRYQKPKAPQL